MSTGSASAYRGMVSSDWNECLAPCGPFDCIAYNHPKLTPELAAVFRQYTGSRITLGQAARRIEEMLPGPLSREAMDACLKDAFATYTGVPQLIEWCARENILFMINTTGPVGYFQRVLALGLLPAVPVLSAHAMIRYPREQSDPPRIYTLAETTDKPRHTATAAANAGIPANRVVLLGDSGGDGPHFAWGADTGALRIGSMAKPSLDAYCGANGIAVNSYHGPRYDDGEEHNLEREMRVDFMELALVIENFLSR